MWKTIQNFNKYEINKSGTIRHLDRKRNLSYRKRGGGYLFCRVQDENNSRRHIRVHDIVASQFLPNPKGFRDIIHIDKDLHNNNVDNLQWVSLGDYYQHYGSPKPKGVWKVLPGYSKYEVNESGEVRNVQKGHMLKSRINKPERNNIGYYVYDMYNDKGVKKSLKRARLIAFLYVYNPNNKLEVDHLNGNTLDDSLENLEWVSRQENVSRYYKSIKESPTTIPQGSTPQA